MSIRKGKDIFDIGQEPRRGAFSPATILEPSQSKTLLQSAGIKIKPLSATPVSQHNVSSNAKGSVGALAQQNKQQTAGLQKQAQEGMSQISDGIRQLKADVATATKAAGHDPGQLYPDERMAASGEIGLAVSALSGGKISGLGSMVTAAAKGVNIGSNVDFFFDDRNSKGSSSQKDKIAEVEDYVRQQASTQQQDTRADIGALTAPSQEPGPTYKSNLAQVVADGHSFEEIMLLDENNPNPKLVPEIVQFAQVRDSVAEVSDNLARAEEEAKPAEGPTNVDTRDVLNADTFKGDVLLAGEGLTGVAAMKLSMSEEKLLKVHPEAAGVAANAERMTERMTEIALHHEPNPLTLTG